MQETLPLSLFSTIETEPKFSQNSDHPLTNFDHAIHNILNSEDSRTIHLRRALGETSQLLSDEQVEVIAGQFQFLIDSWLDEFEKEIFDGLTLKEIINNKCY